MNAVKDIALEKDRSVELIEVTERSLAPNEVRIDVRFCGICGSDLHMVQMDGIPPGLVMGHEFSGAISMVGSDVPEQWAAGDRVTVLPVDACGTCAACVAGDRVCIAGLMAGPGLGRPGGYADTV